MAGIVFSPFVSGMLALGAQHAAFFAEILRGMIQSVASGQRGGAQPESRPELPRATAKS